MPARRTHTKSRNGCARCKKRRVKCDEVHPACGNCVKHAIECDFSAVGELEGSANDKSPSNSTGVSAIGTLNTTSAGNDSLLSPPASTPASTPDSYIGSPPQVTAVRACLPDSPLPSLQNQHQNQHLIPHASSHTNVAFQWTTTDLELMYHYSNEAPSFLASTEPLANVWSHHVPRLAFADRSECVIHAMLAVSALHLAFLESHNRTSRLITATAHYDQAVRTLSVMVPHICRDSCEALFISASLIVVFATASPLIPGNANESEHWSIPEWIPLIRGVYSILHETWNWMENGWLSPLLKTKFYDGPGLSDNAEEALNALYRLCTDTTEPDADEIKNTEVSSTYFGAIHELRKSFVSCIDPELSFSKGTLIFLWPICVSDKYVSLLKQRRPRALIIFAYYCVLLKRVQVHWWVRGRAEYELIRIEKSIRDLEKWQKWLEWPIKMVRGDSQIDTLEKAKTTVEPTDVSV